MKSQCEALDDNLTFNFYKKLIHSNFETNGTKRNLQ